LSASTPTTAEPGLGRLGPAYLSPCARASQFRQIATAPGAETEEALATLARIELAGLRNRARVIRREDSGVCGIPGNPHALDGRNYRRGRARRCSTTGERVGALPVDAQGVGLPQSLNAMPRLVLTLGDRARSRSSGPPLTQASSRSSARPFVCAVRADLSRPVPTAKDHGDPSSGPPWSLVPPLRLREGRHVLK
jgi:hypothetical protein